MRSGISHRTVSQEQHWCHGSTGPRFWVLWVLRPKTRWAQLLDNVQALDVGLLSVSRESGTMKEVERGLSSSEDQEIDC